jgi:hypothetical protein
LAIKEGLNVNLGDVIFYVNNGSKASHGDVQKVNQPKKGWSEDQISLFFSNNEKSDYKNKEQYLLSNGWEKSWSEDNWVRSDAKNKEANTGIPTDVAYRAASSDSVVQLNCYRIDPSDLENNPTMKGQYNIQRAIATFNKRVEPLLVVFKQEVRNGLLVKNPEDRPFFTKDQCELINGQPFNDSDQDKLEDVMEISDEEMLFWNRSGINPYHMYKLSNKSMLKYVPENELVKFQPIT